MLRGGYQGFFGDFGGCPYEKKFTPESLAAYNALKKDPIVQLVVLYTSLFGSPPPIDALCDPLTEGKLKTGRELTEIACRIWGVNPDDPSVRERAINNVYRIFLGRNPDPDGWRYWNSEWNEYKCYTPNLILETLFWCYTPTTEAGVAVQKIKEIVQNYEVKNNVIEYCKNKYLTESTSPQPTQRAPQQTPQQTPQIPQQPQKTDDMLFYGALAGLGLLAVIMANKD